jgi:hypothetical protein
MGSLCALDPRHLELLQRSKYLSDEAGETEN